MSTIPKIIFFKTPADFRKWLEKNHSKETELFLGYYKKDSEIKSITWPESVDHALCFGWIDGLRKSIDEVSYFIRFTPRKKTSIWSAVNLKRVEELYKMNLMMPAGIKIHAERKEGNHQKYSYEQRKEIKLNPVYEKKFKANRKAWKWFCGKPTSYKTAVIFWVMQAKQEKTRLKRLEILMADSENENKIGIMNYQKKPK